MRIGYLIVAGSIAGGYETQSSDVDIRGVYYKTTKDFMLSKPDYIKTDFRKIDVNFWAFNKFYNLLKKGNPTTIEWLLSPYLFADDLFLALRKEIENGKFNRLKVAKHYLGIAKEIVEISKKRELLKKELVMLYKALNSGVRVVNGELPLIATGKHKLYYAYKGELLLKSKEQYEELERKIKTIKWRDIDYSKILELVEK